MRSDKLKNTLSSGLIFLLCLGAASAVWAGDAPYFDDEIREAVEARRGETELSKLAESMEPGTWARVPVEGPGDLRRAPEPSRGLDIGTWSDDAHWDSRTGQFLYLGLRQARRFIAYCEETNEWLDRGLPEDHEAEGSPPRVSRFGHMYSRNALDPATSRFYNMATGIHRYDIRAGEWTKLPPGGSYASTGVIEFFYARNGLLNLSQDDDHELRFFNEETQEWEDLGRIPVHGHHSMARHNPFREEVLVCAGNRSIRTVVRVKKDGTVERLEDAPYNLSITRTYITVDPVSGRYLFLMQPRDTGKRLLYEFDSEKNEYRRVDDFTETEWPFERYGSPVVAYIPEYGVTMWVTRHTWLYKHETVEEEPEQE